MKKRFTDANKWSDVWFRKLPRQSKMLWIYLCDNCDNAGVIELDLELVSLDVGEPIQPEHVAALGDRLKVLPNGKTWIGGFIRFQYGKLSPDCRPHNSVFESLNHNGIQFDDVITPSDENYTLVPGFPQKVSNTLSDRVSNTLQEKEKDKDKDKEGGCGGKNHPQKVDSGTALRLKDAIAIAYQRHHGFMWSYAEECALLEVARRPGVEAELDEILKSRQKRGVWFPQSIETLLSGWTRAVDFARNGKTATSQPLPSHQLKAIEVEIELHPANRESAFFDPKFTEFQRADLRALREKLKTLRGQIARA